MKAHQRLIREDRARSNPRPVVPLEGCYVEQIDRATASTIILEYEWLRSVPANATAFYGLRSADGELIGASVFGPTPGTNSQNVCGEENREITIGLVRGACVHYVHQHAPSYFTAAAVRQAARDHGWRVFVAYQDERAGECGTIYQACNWVYIGAGTGRGGSNYRTLYVKPDGSTFSSRNMRRLYQRTGTSWDHYEALGWSKTREPDKGKYVWLEGSKTEKRRLRKKLRYPALPYPKRD